MGTPRLRYPHPIECGALWHCSTVCEGPGNAADGGEPARLTSLLFLRQNMFLKILGFFVLLIIWSYPSHLPHLEQPLFSQSLNLAQTSRPLSSYQLQGTSFNTTHPTQSHLDLIFCHPMVEMEQMCWVKILAGHFGSFL